MDNFCISLLTKMSNIRKCIFKTTKLKWQLAIDPCFILKMVFWNLQEQMFFKSSAIQKITCYTLYNA